jgi:hypothetical protein
LERPRVHLAEHGRAERMHVEPRRLALCRPVHRVSRRHRPPPLGRTIAETPNGRTTTARRRGADATAEDHASHLAEGVPAETFVDNVTR